MFPLFCALCLASCLQEWLKQVFSRGISEEASICQGWQAARGPKTEQGEGPLFQRDGEKRCSAHFKIPIPHPISISPNNFWGEIILHQLPVYQKRTVRYTYDNM